MASRQERRLMAALSLNVVLVAVQVIAGLVAHSLGLLGDAGHNVVDVGALGLAVIAVRYAGRGTTAERSYGFHRATILAALLNAAAILAVTAYLVAAGVHRLITHPRPVTGGLVLIVALAAAVTNAVSALVLREHRDLNTRAALLHLAGDALASLMVAVAGGIIFATGGTFWLDPLAGIAVGLLISWQALRLLRECARVLLESSPAGLDVAALQAQMSAVEGVASVHDLHVWSLSSELPLLSAHVVATGHPTLEEAQQVGERVKLAVAGAFGITHATLELECEACPPAGCAITPASAATVAYEDGRRHRHS